VGSVPCPGTSVLVTGSASSCSLSSSGDPHIRSTPKALLDLTLTGAYFLAYSSSMLIFKMDRRLVSSMPGSYDWLDIKELFMGERDRLDTLLCNTGLREVVPIGEVRSENYPERCRDGFKRSHRRRRLWSCWSLPKP
jgi:hypothetical protein